MVTMLHTKVMSVMVNVNHTILVVLSVTMIAIHHTLVMSVTMVTVVHTLVLSVTILHTIVLSVTMVTI